MKTLLKNCSILVRTDKGYQVLSDSCIGIDGKMISYIDKTPDPETYDLIKDMTGKLVMPGLVNAHTHGPMTLLRGVGSGLSLQDWLNNAIFPIEAVMTPEDIQAGAEAAVLEMLASGTTFFSEMYDFPWAEASVVEKSGMKCNICRVGLCFDPSLPADQWPRTGECIDLVRNYRHAEGRVVPDFCLHSEYLTTENFVRAISDANHELHAHVNIHVSETKKEHEECIQRRGKTPVAYLNDMGVLDEPCYLAHCVWVTDDDLKIMKEKNATLVHNPTSNMKLGSGFAPIAKALAMGVNVALGTDGTASNNNLNMFEEMHIAALLQKGYHNDPTLVSADQIIDMATVNGAKAMGRTDTGEIAVGKCADLIALDMSAPHMHPCLDAANLIVYSAQASDVCMTMVDGQILYEDGKYPMLDQNRIIQNLEKTVAKLLKL